ncbi:MAG TPA: hypothetical protein VMW47_03705 [Verrucomicrobiae bacterium]|nr:hypothetical protein [Verrucomicrobiae bacterium]
MIGLDPAAQGWGGSERRGPLAAIVVADLRSGWNRLVARTRTPRRLAVYVATLLGLAALVGSLTYGIGYGLGSVAGPSDLGLLTAALTGYAVLTMILGLSTVVTAFFLGRELALLTLAPITVRVIFVARLLVALRANFALGLLLLVGLWGFGAAHHSGPGFLAAGALVAVLLPLGTAGLQLLVLAAAVRLVPPRLARDVANVAGAFVTAVLYVGWLVLTRAGGRRVGASGPTQAALAHLASVGHAALWLPTAWPARALAAVAAGAWVAALPWLLLTIATTWGLLTAAFLAYRGALVSGMGAMAEVAGRRRPRPRPADPGAGARAPIPVAGLLAGIAPAEASSFSIGAGALRFTRAMALKDWRSLRRDVRRVGRLLPALLVAFAYPAVAVPSLHLGGHGALGFWEGVAVTPFVPFLLAEVLAVPAVPLEGRAIQLLRLSPLGAGQLVRAKIVATALPVAGLSCAIALVIGITRHGSPSELVWLVLGVLWLSLGLVATAVGAGAAAPNYGATDPRRAVRGLGVLTANLVGFGFVAASLLAGTYLLVGLGVGGTDRLRTILPGTAGGHGPSLVLVVVPLVLLATAVAGVLLVVGAGTRRLRGWEPSVGDGSR